MDAGDGPRRERDPEGINENEYTGNGLPYRYTRDCTTSIQNQSINSFITYGDTKLYKNMYVPVVRIVLLTSIYRDDTHGYPVPGVRTSTVHVYW